MSRNSKCSYCRVEGHTVRYCGSEEGTMLFNRVRSTAIDHIVLERRPIHERAKLFYRFLVHCCNVEELKLILSRRECRVNGNKKQLAARFIHNYFITELGLGQFYRSISVTDHHYIPAYLTYWYDLSNGKPVIEVDQALNRYLYFNPVSQLGTGNNYDNKYKFPINVVMKTVDLTEEQTEQCFECAICMEDQCPILDQVVLGCNHSFCNNCVSVILTNSQDKKTYPCCALCRDKFEKIQVHTHKIMEDYNTRFCYNF